MNKFLPKKQTQDNFFLVQILGEPHEYVFAKKQTQDNLFLVQILGGLHEYVFSDNVFSLFKPALKLFLSKKLSSQAIIT